MVHGTTVATNAILEGRGARTGLLTTEGSGTCSSWGGCATRGCTTRAGGSRRRSCRGAGVRGGRALDRRRQVLRRDRRGARGRGAARAARASSRWRSACCTPTEPGPRGARSARSCARSCRAAVSLSSEMLRESASTSGRDDRRQRVRAAAGGALPRRHPQRPRGIGIDAPLTIMQSSGGVMTAEDAGRRPVLASSRARPRASSPRRRRARLGVANAIAFDMGGTTAKASVIEGGAARAAASTRSAAR